MVTKIKDSSTESLFRSSQVMKRVNITYRQLCYWELKGIIKPIFQRQGTRDFKRYTQQDVDTLERVKKLLDEGYSLPTTDTLDEIAKRKEAEEALQESEERYRSLTNDVLDTSAVGIFILDKDFKITWVNQAIECYFGIQREKIIGQDKRKLIRKQIKNIFEDPELFAEKALATYDNNTYIEDFECHVLPEQERQERWLEHWSQPIRTGLHAGGRIEHYYDITERKKAEEARQKSQEHFRRVIENIFKFVPESVLVFTDKLNLFKKNKAFQDIVQKYSTKLNYTEQELTELIIEQVRNRITNNDNTEIRISKKQR